MGDQISGEAILDDFCNSGKVRGSTGWQHYKEVSKQILFPAGMARTKEEFIARKFGAVYPNSGAFTSKVQFFWPGENTVT